MSFFGLEKVCARLGVIFDWSADPIGCQQPQKHLPIIVHTAWVTIFNLFKYLNDLQSQPKLFQVIFMISPL